MISSYHFLVRVLVSFFILFLPFDNQVEKIILQKRKLVERYVLLFHGTSMDAPTSAHKLLKHG